MTYIKYLIEITLMTICYIPLLCSCKNYTNNTNTNNNLHKKYCYAQHKLKNNNYKIAIKELETINKKYPFNPYSNQIYFDLIYAYYKSMNHSLTHTTINNFLKLNPNHPNLDYPLYMQGLTNMELNNETNNKLFFFMKKNSKYNPIYARLAFKNFSQLISQYPNSNYALDSYKRLIYLKNNIANHELSIIKYYNQKKAYITVINRTEEMLRNFPDTTATQNALIYMHIAYQKLHLEYQANIIMKIISHNKNNNKINQVNEK